MKVIVEKMFGAWRAAIVQGCQKIAVGPESPTKAEAAWFAKMFRIALRRHDEEKKNVQQVQPKRRSRREVPAR